MAEFDFDIDVPVDPAAPALGVVARSFMLYEPDGLTPKTNATPTFATASGGIFVTRAGTERVAPIITNLGGGKYGYVVSRSDELIGCVAVTALIPDALPSRICRTISRDEGMFHSLLYFDEAGEFWTGAAPTVGRYIDYLGVDQAAPALNSVGGRTYLFTFTPTLADRMMGRHYRVDSYKTLDGVGSCYPLYVDSDFYFVDSATALTGANFNSGYN